MFKQASATLAIVVLLAAVSVASPIYDTAYVSGLWKSFHTANPDQTEINVTAGIAFDPTSQVNGVYNRLYLANRSTADSRQGYYAVDIINETASSRLFLSSINAPSDVAVDAAGNAYGVGSYDPQVWRVADPSGTPVETQMLGNYGDPGDDDPYGIDMVPSGFGGGYTTNDVMIYDGGYNDNDHNAITIIDATSTVDSPVYTTIWSEANTNSIRVVASDYEGKLYLSHWTLDVADLDGTDRAYVLRVDSDGNTERIFLDIDASLVPKLDDAIAINPADGSLWMNIETADSTRDVVRVDVANAAAVGSDYLASASIVIEDLGYNVGANSMAFSPDGALLAVGAPDGQDLMYVYNIVPEPAGLVLLSVGAVMALRRRR